MLNNGWKTYWKNPGDAGSAIQLNLENKNSLLKNMKFYTLSQKCITRPWR